MLLFVTLQQESDKHSAHLTLLVVLLVNISSVVSTGGFTPVRTSLLDTEIPVHVFADIDRPYSVSLADFTNRGCDVHLYLAGMTISKDNSSFSMVEPACKGSQ